MADEHDHRSKPARTAPPFIGPPRGGALGPKARPDRPTLPPFSPPFVRRPSPAVPVVSDATIRAANTPPHTSPPAWPDSQPNEPPPQSLGEARSEWINPDEPSGTAPAQAATGIDWLDSPAEASVSIGGTSPPDEDADDVFRWDPAEERSGALDRVSASVSLDALKEMEPWALPGGEPSSSIPDEIAAALERVAARIRSGDLLIPGGSTATTDEAALASVLAALLQRARG